MEKSPVAPSQLREQATTHLVSQLIHDLRNHFNSLVLEVTDLSEQAAEQGVELETHRLQDLVAEAVEQLQLVRERLEAREPRPSEIKVAEWVTELRRQVLEEPAYEGLVEWPEAELPAGLTASWEAELLGVALGELLDNAADAIELGANGAGPRAHPMKVEVSLDQQELSLCVRNLCEPEQAPKHLEHLGDIRGLAGRRRKLGLGCVFARQVAKKHGGTCEFTYEAAEKEFTAELRLPLAS